MMEKASPGKELHHVRLPVEVLKDKRLNSDAKVAFCFLLHCQWEGRSAIGLPTLAAHLGVSRSTAWRCIRQLEAAGHVINHNPGKGAASIYELLSSVTSETTRPEKNVSPDTTEPQGSVTSETTEAEKFQKQGASSFTGDTHTKRNYLKNERTLAEKDESQDTFQELARLIRRCGYDSENANEEALQILRTFAYDDDRDRVMAWLNYAGYPENARTIRSPIGLAITRARAKEDAPLRDQPGMYLPLI